MAERLPNDVRFQVIVRDEGRCRRCGVYLRTLEIHHRRGRGMGGRKNPHSLATCVLLCGDCHRWAEKERTQAYETGWAIRRSDPRPDSEIPVVDDQGTAWLLDDYGNATRYQGDMHV